MNRYETAFLIAPNLSEEDRENLIQQMEEIVAKKKGKMLNVDKWGKKKLAYPIKKVEEAFYVFFLYEGESDISGELERRFKQTEAVIRYLTVKKDTRENIRRKKKRVSRKREYVAPVKRKAIKEPESPEKETASEEADKEETEE